jgi:Cu-Zn family superoxide dismutase
MDALFANFERTPKINKMKKILLLSACLVAIFIGCKSGSKNNSENLPSKTIKVALNPKSGSNVSGEATFTEKSGSVTFTAKIAGLAPGVHAIHIHEKADCSDPKGASAGGHWNPTFKNHGKWGSAEYHKGDIGNFTADDKGNGNITLTTTEWCIGCGDPNKDIIGKGLIVHEKADDYVTQPTGNAGGRVACAGIIK